MVDWNITVSTMPEAYWKIVSPLIDKAKDFLENGETLAPVAFVGSFSSESVIPVLMESSSNEAKDSSALAIRLAAENLNADFIFLLMEAWSLRKDKLSQMDANMDKYRPKGRNKKCSVAKGTENCAGTSRFSNRSRSVRSKR